MSIGWPQWANYGTSTLAIANTSTALTPTTTYNITMDWYDDTTGGTTSNVYPIPTYTPVKAPITTTPPVLTQDPVMRPPPREFNKFINASDLMEEFIRWLGTEGVRQREVMQLPQELFIKWLILQACEADGEESDIQLQLPAPKQQPRCLGCQRWMSMQDVLLHDVRCADFYYKRQEIAA